MFTLNAYHSVTLLLLFLHQLTADVQPAAVLHENAGLASIKRAGWAQPCH